MKAEFGGVSAGGLGTPLFGVTHSGGGPSVFVASAIPGRQRGRCHVVEVLVSVLG